MTIQIELPVAPARRPPFRQHAAHGGYDGLAGDLRKVVRGEVRFDDGSRALYATDASNYRQVPIGVVIPRDAADVEATVRLCREYGAPILPRGGGTSLAGQCCNVAVVIDMSKYMNRVVALDPDAKRARVQPGTILDDLRDEAEQHKLTFGPDPATHTHCTLGGMIGNNSCGTHAVMAGKTADNIDELEILTYDGLRMRVGATSDEEYERIVQAGGRRGEIYRQLRALRDRYADRIRERFPKIPRLVSGYGLEHLLPENGFNVARALTGTEGTCALVLEATARLVYSPPARVMVALGYQDAYTAGDHVAQIMECGPIALEGFDDRLVHDLRLKHLHEPNLKLLPDGGGWLLVEFGGEQTDEAADKARTLMDRLKGSDNAPSMRLLTDPHRQAMLWKVRESGLGATAHVPNHPDAYAGWEDSAVRPDQLGNYLRDLRKLFDQYGYDCSFYGHFGQGCVHVRIDFDLMTQEGIAAFRRFLDDAADLVVHYGGSLSGEHGDGQARAALLPKMFGDDLVQAFREFKGIWDPQNRMNPGKVVDPYSPTENLRLGADYNPPRLETHFAFSEDGYSFAKATQRCVGVGDCRRLDGGTMCPSFMVTREEKHSTRGRARLLFEMLEGRPLDHGWRSEAVREALDLCLACKGCKGDCPVRVDMATYKAEFLSHYYAGRLRPRSAYAFGLIFYWAWAASFLPRVANFMTQSAGLSALAKLVAGVQSERQIPPFAPRTFKAWFRRRGTHNQGRRPVILWPDTFNNHFHPETARAAVEVLESAGFQVLVPPMWLCCGRPTYDYGMLDVAEHLLRRTLDQLRPQIRAGIPIVGLEPSCVSVFRDELTNLFPHDEDATRLSRQTFLLGEFLARYAPDYQPPTLDRKAIVQGHCHHKAVLDMGSEEQILRKLGLDASVLDSGCCGMAGAFGFERGDHYRVSVAEGERVLLPAVRASADDTVIVADGFSCREQIRQGTNRRALHLAEVIQLAARERAGDVPRSYPERAIPEFLEPDQSAGRWRSAVAASVGALLAGGLVWSMSRRR